MNEKVLASTVRIDITTHDTTGALVAPSSAFAPSDFRVYKDGSASEKTSTNGITVTSPFDSITGKHLIEIDTSNSTGDSGFWATGSEYRVEINSAKTVAGVVQSGVTVGRFRLVSADVLRPTVDGRTLDVSAAGNAGIDWSNVEAPTTTLVLSGTTIGTTTVLTNLPAITANWLTAAGIAPDAGAELAALVETYIVNEGDATAVMQAIADRIAADWVAGDASPLAVAAAVWANATRTITGGLLTTSPPTAAAIADAVWDESRAGHTTDGTFGFYIDAAITSRLAPTVSGRTLNVNTDGEGDAVLNAATQAQITALTRGLIAGVVGSSSSTTVINVTSTESGLAVTDQLKGRVLIFNKDTTTAALRGQGAPIETNDTTSITVASGDAFTTAPASGDTFTIY